MCYTRGGAIPVWMRFTSPDIQALDILSLPAAQDVRLVRTTLDYESPYGVFSSNPRRLEKAEVAVAGFRPVTVVAGPGTKDLLGEIPVPHDARPSCKILNFALEVCFMH